MPMRFRVLDGASAHDRAAWLALWRAWPGREVMAHPEYAPLFARPCDRVVCAVGEDDGGAVVFPLLLRPLATEPWAGPGERRLDAVAPYGYGGPFAFGAGPRDDAAFWRAYVRWCRSAGVVSTFTRLSLFPEQVPALPFPVAVHAPNVVVPLEGGAEAVWRGYATRVRRWVKTAERAGLTVEVDRDAARLDAFVRVYAHTMERNGADAFYLFSSEFFEGLTQRLRGCYAFFHALGPDGVVSSDLVLCSAESVYYFLGGTLEEAFPLGPNYLVKHHVARWAVAQGKARYVLGGGYAPDDGLIRYKRAYTRGPDVPFKQARLVHDEEGYRELAARRAAHAAGAGEPWTPRPGFFPAYRA
jgi:hypothetical protein